jgi:hypothetical protein
MWKFAESTSNRLNSIVNFTNIIETSSTKAKEVEITSALKLKDCNYRKRKINK